MLLCERILCLVVHHVSFIAANNVTDRFIFITKLCLSFAWHEVEPVDGNLKFLDYFFDLGWDIEKRDVHLYKIKLC